MAGDNKPKSNLRRLIGIACSLISLALLTYIAVSLLTGNGLGFSRFSGSSGKREAAEWVDEFNFDVGRGRVFVSLGNSVAAAGTLGIQVLDAGGNETLRDPFRMSAPAVSALEGRAIAFDIGGSSVRVFTESDVSASVEASGEIISASINRNGWFCVCTQEGGGYRGAVMAYNNKGSGVYRVNVASGYVLSAALSPDNKNLAVLSLTDSGSRITFYSLNSEDADNVFDLPGGLIIDISYLPGGGLLAVSTDSLSVFDRHGASAEIYGFSGRLLRGYAVYDDFIALHLLDYRVGYRGRIVTLSDNGNQIAEIAVDREITSMAAGDGYLAILRGDGPALYDSGLIERPLSVKPGATAGAAHVLVLSGGALLTAGDHSAVVVRAAGDR